MSELLQPGYFDWIGPALRAVRLADRWVEIEVPHNIYLNQDTLKQVFINDELAVIKISYHPLYGQTETVSGKIKDDELFAFICKTYYEFTTNPV